MNYSITQLQDCKRLAELFARYLRSPMVLALMGSLGVGKTQWTRFLAEACHVDPGVIASPTFTLMHVYVGTPSIVHVDAFRIKSIDEFLDLGLEEWFEQPVITVIEWPERFLEYLPKDRLELNFEESYGLRKVVAKGLGAQSGEVLAAVQQEWEQMEPMTGGERRP